MGYLLEKSPALNVAQIFRRVADHLWLKQGHHLHVEGLGGQDWLVLGAPSQRISQSFLNGGTRAVAAEPAVARNCMHLMAHLGRLQRSIGIQLVTQLSVSLRIQEFKKSQIFISKRKKKWKQVKVPVKGSY